MDCRKCNEELSEEDISVDMTDIGEEAVLDIIIKCPECGHKINAFVFESMFTDLDD